MKPRYIKPDHTDTEFVCNYEEWDIYKYTDTAVYFAIDYDFSYTYKRPHYNLALNKVYPRGSSKTVVKAFNYVKARALLSKGKVK